MLSIILYEAINNLGKIFLIDKFFPTKKIGSMSMHEYLTVMKEKLYKLEDVNVLLSEPVIVWNTLRNLPKEYDILKQMIPGDKLPIHLEA